MKELDHQERSRLTPNNKESPTLDKLLIELGTKIPLAMAAPTTRLRFDWYFMVTSAHEDYKDEDYEKATVTIPVAALESLSEKEFNTLKQEVCSIISHKLKTQKGVVPEEIADIIDPESPRNILEHECDHCRPLPKEIKSDATISITFLRGVGNNQTVQGIQGFVSYDTKRVSSYDRAISLTEPQSLNATDIEQARLQTKMTGDELFIKRIEERIESKLSH